MAGGVRQPSSVGVHFLPPSHGHGLAIANGAYAILLYPECQYLADHAGRLGQADADPSILTFDRRLSLERFLVADLRFPSHRFHHHQPNGSFVGSADRPIGRSG